MPTSVPTPIAAAFGLVPTVLGGVRRLPGKAVQFPILALSTAMTSVDAARREYDDLAQRGERLIARLRGASFDELEDRVEDSLQGSPFAKPYDAVEDALEDLPAKVGATLQRGSKAVGKRLDDAADTVEDAAASVRGTAEKAAPAAKKAAEAAVGDVPEAEQPKGEPTPHASQPDSTRVDTAASSEVTQTVEAVTAAAGTGEVLEHDQLPLPDYDHMTLGSLRGRMRSLTVEQLVQVRDYEKAHADRLPVVTMLDNRIAKLATDASATPPSGTPSGRPAPGQDRSAGGSKVSPETGAPVQNPPSTPEPTNPAQART